jgi:predicted RNA binding protein YcfA (HicA-like mRNA interferase family)
MTRLTPLKTREVIKGLNNLGFEKVRQKGSHATFHHPDGRRTIVPIHQGRTLSPYFISDILKQLDIDEDSFINAVRK